MKKTLRLVAIIGLGLAIVFFVILNPPAEPDVRIMPLGDSITQGSANSKSYRRALWKLLQNSGLTIDFVGNMKLNYPDTRPFHSDFDRDHEGHWGWRADQVLAKLDSWINSPPPDIVLLHIGSVDILQGQNNKDTLEEIRQIIQILRKHNPKVEIFVAQIIPIIEKSENEQVRNLNSLLPDMVKSITTKESPVSIVNQYEGFDLHKDFIDDGIHPNKSGSDKIAEKWYIALNESLKDRKEKISKSSDEKK